MSDLPPPTPEFNQACLAILAEWRGGKLLFNEAVARLYVLVQRASADRNKANQARAEQLLANLQLTRGNLDACIQHAQRARILATPYQDFNRLAVIDLTEGEAWRYKGNFDQAIRLYRSAYEEASRLDDIHTQSYLQTFAVVNIGLVLVAMGRMDEAQIEFENGISLSKKWDDPNAALAPLCEIHHGMAMIHLQNRHHKEAWDEALRAYEIAQKSDDPRLIGLANRTIGAIVTVHTPSDTSYSTNPDDYFRASIDNFRRYNAEAETTRTMFAQVVSLAQRGNLPSARRKLQQVIIAFKQLGMADDLQQALNFRKTIL